MVSTSSEQKQRDPESFAPREVHLLLTRDKEDLGWVWVGLHLGVGRIPGRCRKDSGWVWRRFQVHVGRVGMQSAPGTCGRLGRYDKGSR